MKIRNGFVSNSSSSSFIIVTAGNTEILNEGYGQDEFESNSSSMDIDEFILMLQKAKEDGATTVNFEYGGGYDS